MAIASALILASFGPAPAHAGACDTPAVLTPAQFHAAALASCKLTGKQVRLHDQSDFFTVPVPGPGDMTVLFADSDDGESKTFAISTSEEGKVAALVDRKIVGHPDAAPRVRAVSAHYDQPRSPASEDVVLGGCGSASSFDFVESQNGGLGVWPTAGYNWWHNTSGQPASNAYTLLDTAFANAIADSSSCGTGATSTPKFSRLGNTTRNGKTNDGYSVIAYEDLPGTLYGVAGYFVSGSNIVEADIRLDVPRAWHMSTSLPVATGKMDFISGAVHEILHNWGLGHVSDADQIMYPTLGIGAGSDRRTKRSGDLAGFDTLYT